jgi:Flp pilus assembly protein CpaB
MRRRRTFLLIFIILVLLLVVGLIALWRLRGGGLTDVGDDGGETTAERPLIPALQATPEVETESVVVAVQTVPRGMRIPPDAIEMREWPIDDPEYPSDPVLRLSAAVGQMARVDIPARRPLSRSMLADLALGEGSEMALAIPKGKVAVAMPVSIMSAVANAIRPGDRVDVLVSFSVVEVDEDSQIKEPLVFAGCDPVVAPCQPSGVQLPRIVSQYTVQNVLVLDVDLFGEAPVVPAGEETVQEGEEAPPAVPSVYEALTELTSVTLVVSPQDALVLKWARESNASIDLAMRSAIDPDIYNQPEAVTLQYMIHRFQIYDPAKLPHAVENEFVYRLPEIQGAPPAGGE